MKSTSVYQLRAGAVLLIPILFIIWSISLVFKSNQKQAELRDNIALINSFNRIAQSLDDLDDEFAARAEKPAGEIEQKRWNDLLASLRGHTAAFDWSHPATPAIRHFASNIDSLAGRMDALYQQARPAPPSAAGIAATDSDFRKTLRLAIDETKSALQVIRARTAAISSDLTATWRQLTRLVLLSCFLAIILGFIVVMYERSLRKRKQAEQALNESDERYRSMIAAMTEGVILQSAKGRILTGNASAEAMLGLAKEHMQGKSLIHPSWRTIHEDGSPFPTDEHPPAATLRTGKPFTNAIMGLQKPDGELRWISINTQPLIRAGEQKPHAVVASFSDVTDHKHAEDALRRQAQIIEQIQDAVVVTDLDGRVKLWNRGAENIFGYTTAEALGRQAATLYALEDQANVPLREKRGPATEGWAKRKSGERCFIHLSMSLQRDEHGAPYGMIGYASDITELKRAEEAWRESEAHTRLIVDTAMDAVITMDAAGKITGWNAQAEAIFGWAAPEILGRSLAETIIPSEHRDAHERGLKHYLTTGEGPLLDRRTELTALRRNGEIFPAEFSVTAILNPNGPVAFSAFLRDITKRRQAEEAVRQSEERYRTLVERMTDGVYRSTPAGKFMEVNPAMVKMLGYECKKELMDIDIKTQLYFDPKEREEMVDVLRETGKDEIEVFRLRHKDGHEVWVEDHGRLVYDAQGNVLYHEGILRDITARLRAEKALRESEERFRTLYEDNPSMFFTVDANGIVLSVNRFGAEQLGYSIEELVGRPVLEVFHEDDKPEVQKQLAACLNNSQQIHHWEFRKVRKDGSVLWVRETARVARSEDNQTIILIVCEDITDLKQAREVKARKLKR